MVSGFHFHSTSQLLEMTNYPAPAGLLIKLWLHAACSTIIMISHKAREPHNLPHHKLTGRWNGKEGVLTHEYFCFGSQDAIIIYCNWVGTFTILSCHKMFNIHGIFTKMVLRPNIFILKQLPSL